MSEIDHAKTALRGLGIRNPSRQLVQNYMRVQQAEECALEVPSPSLRSESAEAAHGPSSAGGENAPPPRPSSSKSNLKPLLRSRGELQRPPGRRKAGRPSVVAPWYQAVATVMANGTPLRQALDAVGVHGLSAPQVRSLYRNTVLMQMRREARQKYQSEYGFRHRRPTARPKGCKGADCLGLSREFLRKL